MPSGVQPRPAGWCASSSDGVRGAVGVDADDLVGVDVGEVEGAVVPAGAFGEGEVVEEDCGVEFTVCSLQLVVLSL